MEEKVDNKVEKPTAFIITDIQKQSESYLAYARNRVQTLSSHDFKSWMINNTGKIVLGATGWFINKYTSENTVTFNSAINEDSFMVNGTDYRDLIPYAIEHEVQESLSRILTRKGVVQTPDAHSIGMMKEFELAAKDGKQNRLYNFLQLIAPKRKSEYQPAYDKVSIAH